MVADQSHVDQRLDGMQSLPVMRLIAVGAVELLFRALHKYPSGAKRHSPTRARERLMQTQRPHSIDFTRNVRHNDQDNV